MKNKLFSTKRIICIFLCVCIFLSMFLTVSCEGGNTNVPGDNSMQSVQTSSGGNNSGQNSSDDDKDPEGRFLDGETEYVDELLLSKVKHDIRYTETTKTVFANGQTDYVIVIPADSSSTISIAESEFEETELEHGIFPRYHQKKVCRMRSSPC